MAILSRFNETEKKIMSASRLFHGLPLDSLSLLIDKCRLKSFAIGDDIITEGKFSRGVYILLSGETQVYLPKRKPNDQLRASEVSLAHQHSGATVGEFSLIDNYPSSASVRVSSAEARLAFLSQMDFEMLSDEAPHTSIHILRNLLTGTIQMIRRMDNELDILYQS